MIGNLSRSKMNIAEPDPDAQPIEGYLCVEPSVERSADGQGAIVNADRIYYRELNAAITQLAHEGVRDITLQKVNGQRYIANALTQADLRLRIEGVPGQDLGMFMGGPHITVIGNAQDGVGNTMEAGHIQVHGSAGDVVGYGMRGGEIFVRGDVGYRVGIHMKQYQDRVPTIVIGGKARDFFGEYMAGGRMILLDMASQLQGDTLGVSTGAGMHGGEIYVRGTVDPAQCGREVGLSPVSEESMNDIAPLIRRFCETFGLDSDMALAGQFTRIAPVSSRPYGNLYASM